MITGVSGSGKSTLAFDILFAEGQRRYLESLNAYARQFVQPASRPDVDAIFGIPPTVAIEQRTSRGGRKSTVATLTEIYHFLRLLYVKLGTQHCPDCQVADRAAKRRFDRGAHPARFPRTARRRARAAGRQSQGLLHRPREVGCGQGLRAPARRWRLPADEQVAAAVAVSGAHHRAADRGSHGGAAQRSAAARVTGARASSSARVWCTSSPRSTG